MNKTTIHADVERILFDEEAIQKRVLELGSEITKAYAGEEILAVCVLKGASVFFADLIRAIKSEVKLEFMIVSSYGFGTESSGKVEIKKDLDTDCREKNILLIEDIIDTGITMDCVKNILVERGAKSVKVASFLSKPSRRQIEFTPDFLGFEIEDHFVVGYGLDYAEQHRNLGYIGILKPEVYSHS